MIFIGVVAFFVSALTFFSGFGLGTLLMPVFALMFPVDLAIALTAIVHFLNNLFKLALVVRHVHSVTLWRFGLPAAVASLGGAWCLVFLEKLTPFYQYTAWGRMMSMTPLKFIVAVLLLFFALMEIIPSLKKLRFSSRHLFAGGLLSGFFGGLSGHQGALRSAFLMRTGLSKESFIATGVAIACFVDISRLAVYGSHFMKSEIRENISVLLVTAFFAFAGVYTANRLLTKTTWRFLRILIACMLALMSVALGAGLI